MTALGGGNIAKRFFATDIWGIKGFDDSAVKLMKAHI